MRHSDMVYGIWHYAGFLLFYLLCFFLLSSPYDKTLLHCATTYPIDARFGSFHT